LAKCVGKLVPVQADASKAARPSAREQREKKEKAVARVEIPPRYRGPTDGLDCIDVEADTVRACIEAVDAQYPGFRELVLDGEGNLRRFVTLFLNGEAVARHVVDTPVTKHDEIQIMAAAAGG